MAFFLSSFAKTIILTPLMLMHWGETVFCFWAIILSVRPILLFLSDGFVRYIANQYNILFHTNKQEARAALSSGVSFLLVFSLLLSLLVSLLLLLFPGITPKIFDVGITEAEEHSLALCLCSYIFAAGMQNVQRMYAAAKEARDQVWHNMVFEVLLLVLEISVMGFLLSDNNMFATVLLADCLLIFGMSLAYCICLFILYPLPGLLRRQQIISGVVCFRKAGRLYASNFFEKLSTDGLVLLLSFFRFDKAAIALFATVRTIANTPLLAQNLLLNTFTPRLQKDFALRDETALKKLLLYVRLHLGKIMLAGIVCCYPLYEPVLVFWTKGMVVYSEPFMVTMLLLTVCNLYGLSFAFILKGLNLLPQLLNLMIVKAVLILVAFCCAGRSVERLGFLLAAAECVVSVIVLPVVLQRFWLRQRMGQAFFQTPWTLFPYLLAAVLLVLILAWNSVGFTMNPG